MKGYISIPQFAKLFGITTVMALFGAPIPNQLIFWAGSGAISAMRLFYFGTFLPHKPRKGATEVMSWAKARSVDHSPTWLSFLQCYNFNMHWEHHRWVNGL
jgi:beta-carotene ketolase (CrtW type)